MQIPQHQSERPGHESKMIGQPEYDDETYKGSSKLAEKVAIVTGGDSGIGRSVAVLFAKEGADVAVMSLNEHEDAKCFVFLASNDSTYLSGQVLQPNGGDVVNA